VKKGKGRQRLSERATRTKWTRLKLTLIRSITLRVPSLLNCPTSPAREGRDEIIPISRERKRKRVETKKLKLTPEPSVWGESLGVEIRLLEVTLEQRRTSAVDLSSGRSMCREVPSIGDVDELVKGKGRNARSARGRSSIYATKIFGTNLDFHTWHEVSSRSS